MNEDNTTRNLFAAINQIPEGETPKWYIWTKCFLLRENDYADLPTEIVNEDFKSAVDQIINLKGFDYNSPITINQTITMHYLLRSLHFSINMIRDYHDGTMRVDARHMVEEDEDITLYFRRKSL